MERALLEIPQMVRTILPTSVHRLVDVLSPMTTSMPTGEVLTMRLILPEMMLLAVEVPF